MPITQRRRVVTTNRRRVTAVSKQKLKSTWKKEMEKKQEPVNRVLRTYNKFASHTPKGRIMIDKNTWIDYNYQGDFPVHKVSKTDKHISRDNFDLPKYPVLKSIVRKVPQSTENLKEMDLFLIEDTMDAIIWNGEEFEYCLG